ncbi:MAG: XRE family transcriptional regulator [Caldilinea sp. CFX5]|nr:XRE family transcriptional regulator [Caldilinea sp. CFX5]
MSLGNKYQALYLYLRQQHEDTVTLTFADIEAMVGAPLPPSARTQRAWWSNRSRGAVQAVSWMNAGYHVQTIDLTGEQVTFYKPGRVYQIRRDGDTILWDGELVKALRHHLGLSQAELADKLGMRQQTISDWETNAYTPRRSTSKYLSLIAEKAGFTYGEAP